MSKFKQGDVAFLKTTGEAVMVHVSNGEGEDLHYKVSRPVMTKDGVRHEVEYHFEYEFFTEAERNEDEFKQKMANYKLNMRLMEATKPQDEAQQMLPILPN